MAEGGFVDRARDRARELLEGSPIAIVPRGELELLEAESMDRRVLQKELDALGYAVYSQGGGRTQEVKAVERMKLAQKSRVVWKDDPQAGASVKLLNDFTFGRGVPRPKAADPMVQEEIDAAWDDPDNQLVLTTFDAQMALGTDMALQSNLFILSFDDGADGKVKLGLLDHDTVLDAVRDSENRLRVLYYKAKERRVKWDFAKGMEVPVDKDGNPVAGRFADDTKYYAHWRNVELGKKEGTLGDQACPPNMLGDGRVFHLTVNRTGEMVFGVPEMARLLRWFNAYNDLMASRVDMAKAASAFVMKRKSKGTGAQIERMAMRAMSRRSDLSTGAQADGAITGPTRPGSLVDENESVTYEPFNLQSGSSGAMQDGQMIRSQISAATRFPQHYLGDASTANLATATALELPVLKTVEARQEVFEQLFRWFIDRVIEKAVEAGRIKEALTPEELTARDGKKQAPDDSAAARQEDRDPYARGASAADLGESYDGQTADEEATKRDLSYEFSMPSPLRRLLSDLQSAISGTATTFDPNGTNIELSRTLLTILLGEGFELPDPSAAVERIFPDGYVDPAIAAAQAAAGGGAAPGGPQPPPGQPDPSAGDNPYGAPMQGSLPENNPYGMTQAWDTAFAGIVNGVALEELAALGAGLDDEPPVALLTITTPQE